jgi:hypothetical protein
MHALFESPGQYPGVSPFTRGAHHCHLSNTVISRTLSSLEQHCHLSNNTVISRTTLSPLERRFNMRAETAFPSIPTAVPSPQHPVLLQEFHPFPRLRVGLRLRIWAFTCKEPQIVSVDYSEVIVGSTYEVVDDKETEQNQCMGQFKFRSHVPGVLQANRESRKQALKYYQLFFSNAPNGQPNTYFNPHIDTCYIALANQSYEIRLIDARTHYIAPSDKLADNQSWNLEHLGFATERLSRPEDLPNFPAVKFMAVDEAFLRQNQEMQTWADFFTYIPSLESFTFVVDGNTRLSRKGRHTKNWKAGTIWSSEINHPSVLISEFS